MEGCNNNRTVGQFSAAFQKLIVHTEMLDIISGNCLPLEFVPILTVSTQCTRSDVTQHSVKIINFSLLKGVKDKTT